MPSIPPKIVIGCGSVCPVFLIINVIFSHRYFKHTNSKQFKVIGSNSYINNESNSNEKKNYPVNFKDIFLLFNTIYTKKSFPFAAKNRIICHLTKLLPEQKSSITLQKLSTE